MADDFAAAAAVFAAASAAASAAAMTAATPPLPPSSSSSSTSTMYDLDLDEEECGKLNDMPNCPGDWSPNQYFAVLTTAHLLALIRFLEAEKKYLFNRLSRVRDDCRYCGGEATMLLRSYDTLCQYMWAAEAAFLRRSHDYDLFNDDDAFSLCRRHPVDEWGCPNRDGIDPPCPGGPIESDLRWFPGTQRYQSVQDWMLYCHELLARKMVSSE